MCNQNRKLENMRNELDYLIMQLEKNDSIQKKLYHYTNGCSANSIENNREFWLTNYLDLEDINELNLSEEIIRNLIKESKNINIIEFLEKFYKLRNKLKCYVLSFCEEKNNDHLWETYAENKNGNIIELDFPPKFKIKYDLVGLKIIYGNDPLYDDFYNKIKNLINICLNNLNDKHYRCFLIEVFAVMLAHAPRFKRKKDEKNYDLSKEREYRLYIHDKDPYIPELNIPKQCITVIGKKERCILRYDGNIKIISYDQRNSPE